MTIKLYNFQEKIDFLEDLVKKHQNEQMLIHEAHDRLSGCTLFGVHRNYSTSINLTLGILNGGFDVNKDDQVVIQTESYVHLIDPEKNKNKWELERGSIKLTTYQINCMDAKRDQNIHIKDDNDPDMTKIITGDSNVALYFKIHPSLKNLFFNYLKDGKDLDKRRMEDLVNNSDNYFDISYVSALKLLNHEEKIPSDFIAEFDIYKIRLIMEIEYELQLISGMKKDIQRKLSSFDDKIFARLFASKKGDELEYKKHEVRRKLETALGFGMGTEERIINLGIPGKYINVREYITGLSKILNVEKANLS